MNTFGTRKSCLLLSRVLTVINFGDCFFFPLSIARFKNIVVFVDFIILLGVWWIIIMIYAVYLICVWKDGCCYKDCEGIWGGLRCVFKKRVCFQNTVLLKKSSQFDNCNTNTDDIDWSDLYWVVCWLWKSPLASITSKHATTSKKW